MHESINMTIQLQLKKMKYKNAYKIIILLNNMYVSIYIYANSIFIDLSFLEEKNRILAEQQQRQRIAQQNRLGHTYNYQPFDLNHPPS